MSYLPDSMMEHKAVLNVSISEDLTWRYPLAGVTENPSVNLDYIFRTKCRTKLQKDLEIFLPDLHDLPHEENFTHEIRVEHEEL